MALRVTQALNLGNDVLEVRGDDGAGNQLAARGWISAMQHYYPPASYDANGNLIAGAQPRAMTQAERLAYCKQLLATVTSPASPADLGISG